MPHAEYDDYRIMPEHGWVSASRAIPDPDGVHFHVPFLYRGRFFTQKVYGQSPHGPEGGVQVEAPTGAHLPVAKGVTIADVDGATVAHDTGTHWEFRHASEGTHRDLGLTHEQGVQIVFQDELDGLNAEIMGLDPRDAPHRRKRVEYLALVQIKANVKELVVKAHHAQHLGHYHQDAHPDDPHILTAIKAGLAHVKTESTALWRRGGTAIGRIETAVAKRAAQAYMTRQQIADAKAKAAAAAEAESASDSGGSGSG